MKKILSITCFIVAMLLSIPANAQLKFGVKGGLDINKVSFSQSDFQSDNRYGFFIGPTVQLTTPVGLAVDASLLFNQRKSSFINTQGVDEVKKMNYINIPINLRYQIGLGSLAGIYLATGPQFSFNLDDKYFSLANLSQTAAQYKLNKSEFGWNVGGGVRILRHLEVGYNYCFPIGKTSELETNSPLATGAKVFKSFKNKTHQVSVAYIF